MVQHRSCRLLKGDLREWPVTIILGWKYTHPDRRRKASRTPPLLASPKAREGVVKILSGREDIIPDVLGKDGQTPFSRDAGGANIG